MKKYFTLLLVTIATGITAHAQDIHFSQFYENSVLTNPALTGVFSGEYKVGVDYRNQWATVANPFTTTMISAETRIMASKSVNDYISFGFGAYYDRAGAINFTSTEVYPSIAYNKALEDQHGTYLSLGFTGGIIGRNVDPSKMTFSTQYIPSPAAYAPNTSGYFSTNPSYEPSTYKSLTAFDLGTGVSLNGSIDRENKSNYYLGIAVYHLNHPTEVFYAANEQSIKLPIKSEYSAGLHLVVNNHISFSFRANYSLQDPYSEFVGGGLITFKNFPTNEEQKVFAFSLGLFYRSQDAIIPTVKIDYGNVSFGYSYDVTNSSLTSGTSGASASEVTVYLHGNYVHKKDPRNSQFCPRFDDDIYYPFKGN